ncbi:hydrogen peroxide-inducible genes activator [Phyllobacterium endophyticum]|jgi:LysR family hydrogen peroxide-inducible transcriptional activator|uniref:LysR family transcriptional regulator n=1 Tax=Phyllobacterium endophyticum TaxID=1149773 RepID=A0A2P7B1B7_9HYPH|nr:hydrogen peroxide-inducible genes activator [Phyllobacterium endophyticum]MBB3237822.1 LysR family hydrogen peroxide-inducible transcriptional activator [Phyllobacterium endophyticum]PSH60265.1 LysR family transcriptional regulator [Phyllobacterium endophyticum]TXR48725.1 hydrogen peroxide-inducible genes activator [Phyllobacterium endophyticum]TYR42436.1 hydrogen peroxide-inducible genes activator [Phyllobacterium endophyticum]
MFSVRQMRYFDILANTLHFRKAAEMARISQPALSAQIAEMELLLGAPLFERTRRTVVLTDMGRRLLPRIRSILDEIRSLEELAGQRRGILRGRLRLGIIPTIAPYLLPLLVPDLRETYPDLTIELREAVTSKLVEDLRLGDLDAIVAALPVEGEGTVARPLFRDRFLIATSTNDIDVLTSPMTQEDVALQRLLLLEEGHCLREQALAVCSNVKQRQLVNYGATSMTTLLQMVSHGMGLTLIPEIAVRTEASRNNVRIVAFADPEPSREIGLIWRKQSERRDDFEALAVTIVDCSRRLMMSASEMNDLAA